MPCTKRKKRGDLLINFYLLQAKDIAYRVVAENLDAKTTPVVDIMTKGPMCVTSDTSATEALNLMVSRGFRHLV